MVFYNHFFNTRYETADDLEIAPDVLWESNYRNWVSQNWFGDRGGISIVFD